MPLLEFECRSCSKRFEELVRAAQRPACPACGSTELERLYSPVSPGRRIGLSAAQKRASDSRRGEREAVRKERAAERRKKGP
jgi:putative FmdB family regulatory protein